MRRNSRIGLVLGMVGALGMASSSASAQNLELSELAAALAFPVITGGQAPNAIKATQGDVIVLDDSALTLITVTNGRGTPTTLKIDVISGDQNTPFVGGDSWQSDSFDCLLTGRETVTFLIVPDDFTFGVPVAPALGAAGSAIYAECSTALGNDGIFANNVVFSAKAQNGIFFVAAGDPVLPGNIPPAIGQDILFGDAVVIDVVTGQAYSFAPIAFQDGADINDGDKVYKFDGQEYAQFPSSLATNFIAPNFNGNRIRAELILFTLDGTTSNAAPPRAAVSGLGWDDDETPFNWSHEFDCFDVVDLLDITNNFSQEIMAGAVPGTLSGHLTMTPQPIATAADSHDVEFGDGNGTRRRAVHGWIVQQALGGNVILAGQPHAAQIAPIGPGAIPITGGPAAWGRPLNQNRFALAPVPGDLPPVLNAESTNP